MEHKFDLEDITIVPAPLSIITSRSQINIENLPLIAAPMDSVIDNNSMLIFTQQKILTCSIRNEILNLDQPFYTFIGVSLQQFEYILHSADSLNTLRKEQGILIDIANGHMKHLYDLVKLFKSMFPNIPLMVGNIANPETYKIYCEILNENDYIRLSIGSGSACFVNDTKVLTKQGYKNIQDIVNCDYVLTHTGEYKKVINTISYKSSENLLQVNKNISTKDHKYYVLHEKFSKIINDDNIHDYAEWISADKLNTEYFLLEIAQL